MPTEILEPNSCDKTTSGWNPCGACSVSGGSETCNCETASGCSSGSVEKSGARFYNFDAATQQAFWTSVLIKVDWKLYAETGDDPGSCDQNKLYLQYKTASSWNNFSGFPKTASGSNQTGTATQSISTGQNIANVQVRMYALAECCSPCQSGADDQCCVDIEGHEICWCVLNCGNCTGDCSPGAC